jgi:transglutaminase-like putative cysteine protease
MATLVTLQHRTAYRYDRHVQVFPQIVRLKPAAHSRTPILNYSLRIEPAGHFINWQQDPQGNFQARVVFPEKTRELSFLVDLTAELHSYNPFDFFLEPEAESFPFSYSADLEVQLAPFLIRRESGPQLEALASAFRSRKARTIDFLVELNQEVRNRVNYLIRLEPGVQNCEETLQKASGSCRDSAFLLVQLLRHLGLAARFVSGYLIQLVPDEKPLKGPQGPLVDFTDLHAWAEVYLPGAGWIGLDATSGLFAAEGHIPLACSPEPLDAAPITGATEPCEASLEFHMSVQRIQAASSVAKPFTEEQWQTIVVLGQTIDHRLKESGVHLTIGGEPTFVSEEDRDLPEWNIAANGVHKKAKACSLAFALHKRFAPGASLHSGQGKWYPGEDLPRWAYSIFARADGAAVWRNETLLARETDPGSHGVRDAEAFVKALSFRLTGASETVMSAYEDAYYYLWKEGNLPRTWISTKKTWNRAAKERGCACS